MSGGISAALELGGGKSVVGAAGEGKAVVRQWALDKAKDMLSSPQGRAQFAQIAGQTAKAGGLELTQNTVAELLKIGVGEGAKWGSNKLNNTKIELMPGSEMAAKAIESGVASTITGRMKKAITRQK